MTRCFTPLTAAGFLFLMALPQTAEADAKSCVVEAGRNLTARDISLQCGVSEAEVEAIRASLDQVLAGQAQMQTMLLQLMQQSDDYARMRAGGVTEANLIALAKRVSEDVTDPGQAFAQLSQFVQIAIDQQRRARDNPSSDAFVAAVQRRVADLSAQGDLDGASAEADRAVALWEAEQENQRQRGMSLLETARDQDVLAGKIDSAADRSITLFELQNDKAATAWDIHRMSSVYRNLGLRFGSASDQRLAVALRRRAVDRAETAWNRAAMQNSLGNALQEQGIPHRRARGRAIAGRRRHNLSRRA